MEGVSTRRVDDLVKALGCEGISKSQVSRICQELDVVVDGFMDRPLGGGPYPYLWLDALTQKVREAGRIVNPGEPGPRGLCPGDRNKGSMIRETSITTVTKNQG